jgi:hypothetical protein
MKRPYTFKGKIWLYPGENANWHFVTVPKELAATIKKKFGAFARGFGSLPVLVKIGKSEWKTSIFPDSRAGTYFLPLKAKIRKQEDLYVEDTVIVSFSIST